MAAVQELFKRLRSRRSLHKKETKTNKSAASSDGGANPQLGNRVGVALPPVPPPGFLNLPDISRDCAKCSSWQYDEIPAYAIDTRLDILRDAYLERKRTNSLLRAEIGKCPLGGGSSRNVQEFRQHHGESADLVMMRRRRSLPGDDDPVDGEQSTARLQRQGTPWNHGYIDDCPDQLDQWVSVPESLNALHLDDGMPERPPKRDEDTCNQRQHPWYEEDSSNQFHWDNRNRELQRHVMPPRNIQDQSCQNTLGGVKHRQVHASDSTEANRKQYPSPPPGALSDDSGVSSPSSRESHDIPWGSGTTTRHQLLRHYREYSDSDSSTYYRKPQGSSNKWRHCQLEPTNQDGSQSESQDSAHARLDISSSDTYNEYEQNNRSFSDLDSFSGVRDGHANESMSPQEYTFYLRKIRNNLCKSHSVKSFASCDRQEDGDSIHDDWEDTCDSIDLTSVTSLSEISTLSQQEIANLIQEKRLKPEQSYSRREGPCRSANDPRVSNDSCTTNEKLTSCASEQTLSNNGQQQPSAFRPYPSKHRYSRPSTSLAKRNPPELPSDSLTLADKLSCRVTTSKPRPLSARVTGVTSQKARAANSHQYGGKTQNLLLSDLMRRNHDRQILVVI
ncbi:hypothetical protein LSH36_5g17043 [Paralvinella palmiformis]|uniref:Uncharacterized protein n=1 Tax=Paralvinella palmiformis TaxID=53620 RepID=A0AAD9KFA1_9ANNE|nr:hypothetical protein LSH36_5g17043 [Paralvinella palmiformis]